MDNAEYLQARQSRHPALAGWMPGVSGVAVLRALPWALFAEAERIAAAIRCDDSLGALSAHVVASPDDAGACVVVCPATDLRRARRALIASERSRCTT